MKDQGKTNKRISFPINLMLNSNQGLSFFRQTQSLSRHKQGFHHLNLVSSLNPDKTYILEKKGLELVTL